MKNFLKSWFKGKSDAAEVPTESSLPVTPEVRPLTTPKAAPRAPQPVRQQPRPQVVSEVIEPEAELVTNIGPELKTAIRGSKLYGTCPHCEATWNVKERLMNPSFKRVDRSKGLTCPSCNQSVSLPATLDLRKLQ